MIAPASKIVLIKTHAMHYCVCPRCREMLSAAEAYAEGAAEGRLPAAPIVRTKQGGSQVRPRDETVRVSLISAILQADMCFASASVFDILFQLLFMRGNSSFSRAHCELQ